MNLPPELELQKLQHKLNPRYTQRINDGTHYATIKDVIRRGDALDALDAHFTFQDSQKKTGERERRPRQRNASTSSQSSGSFVSSRSSASTIASRH
ncbi:unnamed protein product [Aureobasidium vineae]|uniref:Uncharacterized protein n=1 Tax=Aureobasidium vineae TaxID=2773715 RepID=A0A9N8J9E8_9PEZI|nr:unnamed protein product [Aureobasidium vineae]